MPFAGSLHPCYCCCCCCCCCCCWFLCLPSNRHRSHRCPHFGLTLSCHQPRHSQQRPHPHWGCGLVCCWHCWHCWRCWHSWRCCCCSGLCCCNWHPNHCPGPSRPPLGCTPLAPKRQTCAPNSSGSACRYLRAAHFTSNVMRSAPATNRHKAGLCHPDFSSAHASIIPTSTLNPPPPLPNACTDTHLGMRLGHQQPVRG